MERVFDALCRGQRRARRNLIMQVRRSTLDIEPNSANWGARRVTIANVDIGPWWLIVIAGQGYAAPVEDIVVTGNRLKGKAMNISLKAQSSKRRTNFSLIGNVSHAASESRCEYLSPASAARLEHQYRRASATEDDVR